MVFGIFNSGKQKRGPALIIKQAEDELFSIHGTGRAGAGLRVLVRFGMSAAVCGLVTSTVNSNTQAEGLGLAIKRIHFDFFKSAEGEGSVVYGDIFSSLVNPRSFNFSKKVFMNFHSYGEPSLIFEVPFSKAYEELMEVFYQEVAAFVAEDPSIALSRAAIVIQELILGPLDKMNDRAALFNQMHSRTQASMAKLTKDLLTS